MSGNISIIIILYMKKKKKVPCLSTRTCTPVSVRVRFFVVRRRLLNNIVKRIPVRKDNNNNNNNNVARGAVDGQTPRGSDTASRVRFNAIRYGVMRKYYAAYERARTARGTP